VLEPGAIVGGKFRIERVLGEGGMGVVAVAMHLQLDQRVALKVLHARGAGDPETVQRFLREARAAAKLKSDHICRVTDVGQLDDLTRAPYIVMELLEGGDLASVLGRNVLAPAVAIDYVLQACVGLAEAHSHGIVHRDLKPANLFVTRRLDGAALIKILDFGIAKSPAGAATGLTQTATVMGTPGYMAPEQLRSTRDVDVRADIWALGVILYQALSGRLPFPANSITEFAVKTAMEPPDPIDLPPQLRAVVLRCLEKDPAGRFPDVASLAQALVPFGGPTARAHAQLAATLAAPGLGNASTMMAASQQVPTTLQVASGVATPTGARTTRSGRRGVWIAGGLAAAVLAAVVVVAVTASHDEPGAKAAGEPAKPTPVVAAALPAVPLDAAAPASAPGDAAWPDLAVPAPGVPAAPAAAVAVSPHHPARPHPAATPATRPQAVAADNPQAVAPFVPPPAPAQPALTDAEKIARFDQAIATRHCQRALTIGQGLYAKGPQYMQKVQACMQARSKAMQDYASPETEPWMIALAEDMAEMGQGQNGEQALAGYYYARTAKACQAKDAAAAKASYAKIKAANLHETAQKVCHSLGIDL
jgi:eukaryotic-like serine/threonine-protein kinase